MKDFGEGHGLDLFGHDYLKVNTHSIFISLGSDLFDKIVDGAKKKTVPLDECIYFDREVPVHQFEQIFEALEADLVGRLLESVVFTFISVETFAGS